MKKVVISGSSKLQGKVKFWINHFEEKGYEVIDYPKQLETPQFNKIYPKVLSDFYKILEKTDIYFQLPGTIS